MQVQIKRIYKPFTDAEYLCIICDDIIAHIKIEPFVDKKDLLIVKVNSEEFVETLQDLVSVLREKKGKK